MKAAIFVVAALLPTILWAQPAIPDMERVLVPILVGEAPGAYGSNWESKFVVANNSADPVVFGRSAPFCNLPGCGLLYLEPFEQKRYHGGTPENMLGAGQGALFVVEREKAHHVQFSLLVRDKSREHTVGTELPVVRESRWLGEPVELIGVPTSSSFRYTLRIYEPRPTNIAAVRVLVYSGEDQRLLLGETVVPLRGGSDPVLDPDWPARPAYAQIDLVSRFPQIAAVPEIRLRIEPVTDGLRYWAFVSVTHQETQHVRVIWPQ